MKEQLDKAGVANQHAALCQASGEAFYNVSAFNLRDLASLSRRQQLKADFEAYLDGYSPNVQEVLDKFKFRNQIPTLIEADALGFLIEKFLDPSVNLSPRPVLHKDGSVRLPALDLATARDRDAVEYPEEPLPKDARASCGLARAGVGLWSPLLRTVGTVLNDGDPRVVNKNLARRGLRGSCARQWNRVHSSHGCGLIRSESLAEHFGSRLRSLAECDGGPRSDHARFLLPLTERLNVCHHALGRREGFARTNLRPRHGLRAAAWQQNQNKAKPEYRSQKEPHITPLFPGCFPCGPTIKPQSKLRGS
jgi:hypothetical protein